MSKLLVVLDPGHYPNYNKGAVNGYFEGDKMYELCEYEKEELKAYGIPCIITRTREKDKPLYDRGQVAVNNSKGYDNIVFISNHSNAFNKKTSGVEGYRSVYLPKSEELGVQLIKAVVNTMNPVTKITNNRGLKTKKGNTGDYYGVIRGAVSGATSESVANKRPVKYAYIIEHGFHDNITECSFLNNSNNLKKIAKAKVEVIAKYFGYSKPVVTATKTVMYRVRKSWGDVTSQIGAYKDLSNAKAICDKNKGYKVYDNNGKCVYTPTSNTKKSVTEIAKEVIAGKWGTGEERKKKLQQAGYNYTKVQGEVNKLLKK